MKNILIIGLGRYGLYISKELNKLKAEILAVDVSEDNLQRVANYVSKTIIGDSTDIEFLKTLGINTFDDCIVTIGDNFQASLETVLNLKELGANRITARAATESQQKLLEKIGADLVVYPERQLAKWTALQCGTDSIYDFMDLDNEYGIYEVNIPKEWAGKTLAELDLRKKYSISIIGVKTKNKMRVVFGPNFVLNEDASVLIMAKEGDMNKILVKK